MKRLVAAAAALFCGVASAMPAPRVIASVVPLHSIVAAVMGDLGEPELLLAGSRSEHRASFSPAELAALSHSDLVFIIGHGLEAKLASLSGSAAVGGRTFIELAEAPGMRRLAVREGGAWEAHRHDEEEEAEGEHDHEEGVLAFDPHVWLDPDNARTMAVAIATHLGSTDPANAPAYAANAARFAAETERRTAAIATRLASVRDQPFIVFHDAYQYFERRFDLSGVGSITDVAARAPSAARLAELRRRLAESGAVCVFREPQYDDRWVNIVLEGSVARAATLDPIGATLRPGPQAYGELLDSLAAAMGDCLGG